MQIPIKMAAHALVEAFIARDFKTVDTFWTEIRAAGADDEAKTIISNAWKTQELALQDYLEARRAA